MELVVITTLSPLSRVSSCQSKRKLVPGEPNATTAACEPRNKARAASTAPAPAVLKRTTFRWLCRITPRYMPNEPLKSGLLLPRSEEHTSELQSLMRISNDVFCLKI